DELIVGLIRVRVPYKVAFVFASTLRFVPLILGEIQAIIEAQQLRGLDVEKMGLPQRLRIYARIAVPLILGALVRSQQVEVVLASRAFSGSPDRTYLHESHLHRADYLALALAALALVAAVTAFLGWGIGSFAGPA
ncbi:MAG: energy-coupling factor transporter transmembrane protein EcfT, partial [Chloroflexi bacterium]|nr:energy-coupling factor transporter transmembrane protein EcfT [Chloroflexota bacterium]